MMRYGGLRAFAVAGLLVASMPAFADGAGFPYTDENCGVTTTYEAPPARAVTLGNNATEMMLALGLVLQMEDG